MTALHLAGPDDLNRLETLVAAFHAERKIEQTDEARHAALVPLLDGIPHGCAYLIGPTRAPIGHVIVTFTWSVEFGGLEAAIDEFYIRPAVRRRGIATEVLASLPKALSDAGVQALHLDVDQNDSATISLYERAGFRRNDRYVTMSRRL